MANGVQQTQDDIRASLTAFPTLAQQPETPAQQIARVKAAEALDATDTDITNNTLTTDAAAINALAARLNANATDLNSIHQRVVDLTNSMNQLKSAADALGRLAGQLPKPTSGR